MMTLVAGVDVKERFMKRNVNQWLMLLAAGLLAAFGVSARADEVLYWIVDNPTITSWWGVQKTAAEMGIEGARVAAFKTDDTAAYLASRTGSPTTAPSLDCDVVYLDLYNNDGGSWVLESGVKTAVLENGTMDGTESRASIGVSLAGNDYSTYSFAIELYTWDSANEKWVYAAMSESETYANLTGYIQQQVQFPEGIWTPGAYVAPEPTSGMLMIIGFALLGLKRKKV